MRDISAAEKASLLEHLPTQAPEGWTAATVPTAEYILLRPLMEPRPGYSDAFPTIWFEYLRLLSSGSVDDVSEANRRWPLFSNRERREQVRRMLSVKPREPDERLYSPGQAGLIEINKLDELFCGLGIQAELLNLDPDCYVAPRPLTDDEWMLRQIDPAKFVATYENWAARVAEKGAIEPSEIDRTADAAMLSQLFKVADANQRKNRARDASLVERRVQSRWVRFRLVVALQRLCGPVEEQKLSEARPAPAPVHIRLDESSRPSQRHTGGRFNARRLHRVFGRARRWLPDGHASRSGAVGRDRRVAGRR